jgi:hypothetical protein
MPNGKADPANPGRSGCFRKNPGKKCLPTAGRAAYDVDIAPSGHFSLPLFRQGESSRAMSGCEKMGLAPSRNDENPRKSGVAKVPVPIFFHSFGA